MARISYKTQADTVLPSLPELTGDEDRNREDLLRFLQSILEVLENLHRNVRDDIDLIQMPLSQPENPTAGNSYFNTADDKIYVWNGTSWVSTAALT